MVHAARASQVRGRDREPPGEREGDCDVAVYADDSRSEVAPPFCDSRSQDIGRNRSRAGHPRAIMIVFCGVSTWASASQARLRMSLQDVPHRIEPVETAQGDHNSEA